MMHVLRSASFALVLALPRADIGFAVCTCLSSRQLFVRLSIAFLYARYRSRFWLCFWRLRVFMHSTELAMLCRWEYPIPFINRESTGSCLPRLL